MKYILHRSYILKNILFYSSCLIACMPLLHPKIQVVSFIILGIAAIIDRTINKDNHAKTISLKVLVILPIGFYLLLISSIIYSSHIRESLFFMEKSVSFISVPLILFISRSQFRKKQVTILLAIFILSCSILSLFMLYKISLYIAHLNTHDITIIQAVTNIRNHFADVSGTHPTYLSTYFLFSCLILSLFILSPSFSKKSKILFIPSYLILLFISILLAARMPLFSFSFIQILILFFTDSLSVKIKIAAILFIAFILIMGSIYVPTFNQRLKEVFSTELKPPVNVHYNSTNLRVGITMCSIEIIKNNWLFGVGIGDSQYELNKCLYKFNTTAYEKMDYNPHNQYLSIWLSSGIISLIVFLIFMGTLFKFAHKTKNSFLLILLLLVSLNMVTEDFLFRQAGILFFMFFYFVFCKSLQRNNFQ